MVGIRRGWGGLINYRPDADEDWNRHWRTELDWSHVRTIDRTGGTFLHTSRTNPGKVREKDMPAHLLRARPTFPADLTDVVVANLEHLQIDALIPIGGDDTLSYAARLHQAGYPQVAIPKTMDNDVYGHRLLHRLQHLRDAQSSWRSDCARRSARTSASWCRGVRPLRGVHGAAADLGRRGRSLRHPGIPGSPSSSSPSSSSPIGTPTRPSFRSAS